MNKIFLMFLLASLLLPNMAFADEATTTPEVLPETIISTTSPADNLADTLTSSSTPSISTTTVESVPTSTQQVASSLTDDNEAGPTITSGDAVAMANVLNLVNTNFINSNGVILFSNFFDYIRGSLDLRNASASLFDGLCITNTCSGNNTSVNISNQAAIDNFLLLQALTGGNSIASSTGTSTINSGDAYAGLNLINLANTNFVDSEYLLVTLNAFHGVDGDIVFPSLSNFFNSLGSSGGSVQLTNGAEVENNIDTNADTGGNSVENGNISTGSASSTSNVFNQLNTTLVGGANVSILFRVHGSWVGDVFGAPDNLGWTQGADGSIYLFDVPTGSTTPGTSSNTNVSGSNNTLIRNNVTVMALTGNNKVTGPGTGVVSTGNAVAGANIVNIANSNIIGRNWIMAIVNIFGDFKGNIAFGRPDLWVGEQISAPQDIYKDSVLDYKLTIINNGDSPATKIKLTDDYDSSKLEIISSSFKFEHDGNGDLVWDIGNLPPGKATEITYQARVSADSEADVTNSVSVSARETDNNTSDNTDTASVHIKTKPVARSGGSRRGGSGGGSVLGASTGNAATTSLKSLSVLRTPPVTTAKGAGIAIEQKLIVTNPTGQAVKSAIFKDILKDRSGEPIHTEVWNLGDILPHEEVILTYSIEFDDKAQKGFYSLTTRIESGKEKLNIGVNGLVLLGSMADLYPSAGRASVVTASIDNDFALEAQKPHVAFVEDYVVEDKAPKKDRAGLLPLGASFALIPLLLLKLYQVFW